LCGLTLLPRLVFLHDPVKVTSKCILCGEKTSIIHTCQLQTAGRQENEYWNDPHVFYLDLKPRKSLRALDLVKSKPFRFDRPWHDLLSRIIEARETASFLAVGFASDKAKYVDVWERSIDLPSKDLIPETVVSSINRWRKDSSDLDREIRPRDEKGAARKRKHPEFLSLVNSIRPHVEHTVSGRISELIQGGDKAWERAAEEYGPLMKSVAVSLAPGCTATALRRRTQIAEARPGPGSKMQSGRMKGGGK
jgi:hypothetical protein